MRKTFDNNLTRSLRSIGSSLAALALLAFVATQATAGDAATEKQRADHDGKTCQVKQQKVFLYQADGSKKVDLSSALDLEVLKQKLDGVVDAEKLDEILASVKANMRDLHAHIGSAPGTDGKTAKYVFIGSDDDAAGKDIKVDVQRFSVDKDVEVSDDGSGNVQAVVKTRKVNADGTVSEEILEGDEALNHANVQVLSGANSQAVSVPSCANAGFGAVKAEDLDVREFIDEDGKKRKIVSYQFTFDDSNTFDVKSDDETIILQSSPKLQVMKFNSDAGGEIETSMDINVEVEMEESGQDGQKRVVVTTTDENGEVSTRTIDLSDAMDGLDADGDFQWKGKDAKLQVFSHKMEEGSKVCASVGKVMFMHMDVSDVDVIGDGENLDESKLAELREKINNAVISTRVIIISDGNESAEAVAGEDSKPAELTKQADDSRALLLPENFNLYPNPSDGRFNLEFTLPGEEPAEVRIVDMQGKEVFRDNNVNGYYNKQIDISTDAAGTYFLQIKQGNQSISRKIEIK